MAKFDIEAPFDHFSGKLSRKTKIIYRHTRRYDDHGRIIMEDKHAYEIIDKRDYRKKPRRGAEKRNMERIQEAQRLTQQFLNDENVDLTELRERFERQLATGKPDPEAPILRKTGQRRIYSQFDRFIYALIYAKLKEKDDNA